MAFDGTATAFSPTLLMGTPHFSPDATAYALGGSTSILNGENMALSARPLPIGDAISVLGTVSDATLDRFEVRAFFPDGHDVLIGQGQAVLFDKELAKFSPNFTGPLTFRLTAWDKAGNQRQIERRFDAFSGTQAIAEVRLDDPYFSPNNDGVKDMATVKYRVLAPTTVVATVRNSAGTSIRTIAKTEPSQGSSSIAWDGRNNSGFVVADGDYSIFVGSVGWLAHLDTSAPAVSTTSELKFPDGKSHRFEGAWGLSEDDLELLVTTVNLENGFVSSSAANAFNRRVSIGAGPDILPMAAAKQQYTLRATDRAGNSTVRSLDPLADAALAPYVDRWPPGEEGQRAGRPLKLTSGQHILNTQWTMRHDPVHATVKALRTGDPTTNARVLGEEEVSYVPVAGVDTYPIDFSLDALGAYSRALLWVEFTDSIGFVFKSADIEIVSQPVLDLACAVKGGTEGSPPSFGYSLTEGPFNRLLLLIRSPWDGSELEAADAFRDGRIGAFTRLFDRRTPTDFDEQPLLPDDCARAGCESCVRDGFPAGCEACLSECAERSPGQTDGPQWEAGKILAFPNIPTADSCFQKLRLASADTGTITEIVGDTFDICRADVDDMADKLRVTETFHFVRGLPRPRGTLTFKHIGFLENAPELDRFVCIRPPDRTPAFILRSV